MKKQKLTSILFSLILTSMFFTACGPKTVEQQVEIILKSEDVEERKNVSYALADSLSIKASELFLGLHPNPLAIEALENILDRYSEIITSNPSETEKALACIRFITEPSLQPQDSLNEQKIELIIHALQINNLDIKYEEALITAAKQHGNSAMIKIIDAWYENRNSSSLFNAIQGFNNEAISFLVNKMETDTIAINLLARFGQPVVNTMIEKMKDNEQAVRFAAGDVLVQMLKYDPNAIDILTSAIDNGGIKIIAKNYPFYIRLGQPGTEKILLKALNSQFNQEMCVDYLNCGNTELESGASDIAAKHGYWVTPSFGGHGGPKWGSGN
jgi:hypothetical protein